MHPTTWMATFAGCERVRVRGLREIGAVVSSDGIDVVGSRDVRIEDCFLRNNDDCLVVKHVNLERDAGPAYLERLKPVERVVAERCVLFNAEAGNALEIGHELLCDEVRDVAFRDLDILRVDGHGAAFSIHAGDQAAVRDILYENIRVEHHYDKLVDFRVMRSQFNRSPERGRIENIVLKDIDVAVSNANPGYTVSCLGGWDAEHPVDGVHFRNVRLGGRVLLDDAGLDLHYRHARNVTFEA